jgi:hypothetical protein
MHGVVRNDGNLTISTTGSLLLVSAFPSKVRLSSAGRVRLDGRLLLQVAGDVTGIAELHGNLSVDARGELDVSGAFRFADGAELAVHGARASRSRERSPSARARARALAELNGPAASAASGLITVCLVSPIVALGASAELDHSWTTRACSWSATRARAAAAGATPASATPTRSPRSAGAPAAERGSRTLHRPATPLSWCALATVSGAPRSSGRAQVLLVPGARLILAQDSMSSIDGDAPSVVALGGLEVAA